MARRQRARIAYKVSTGPTPYIGAATDRVRADQERRRSGAAGVHNAPFLGRKDKAGGKTGRVGSRATRRAAAARDGW